MTGFTFEPFKRTDYAFEKAFSVSDTPIVPLNRSIDGIDVIYQGNTASCVSCAVTWIQQWYEQSGIRLSWPFLAEESGTTNVGNKPSNVLTVAKNVGICPWDVFGKPEDVEKSEASGHRIKNYSFLSKITPQTLYSALIKGPIGIGITNFQGQGYDHFIAAYDVNENGTALKCVNWDNPDVQSLVEIPFDQVTTAVSFATIQGVDLSSITMSLLSVLKSKLSTSKVVLGLLAIALLGSFGTSQIDSPTPQDQNFGQSGVSLGYAPSIASPGISNTATSIPVTSLTLYTGETITTSTLLFPAYFVINPGSLATQELVECWGLTTTTTSPTWTLCNRGMSALGGPTTSTVTGANFPHSAGEKFVMTNAPPFFNRFVDTMTNQYATGTKRFTADQFYLGSSTSSVTGPKLLFSNGQTANPYFRVVNGGSGTSTFYVSFDGTSESALNSGGTVYGASSTKGIFITDGLIGVNASTTAGITFGTDGLLAVSASSSFSPASGVTGNMTFGSDGRLYFTLNGITGNNQSIFFGTGSDGAVVFNGSNDYSSFATRVTSTYRLIRDVHATTIVASSGITIATNGFKIYATESVSSSAFIIGDGTAGQVGTAGSAGGLPGFSYSTGTLGGGISGARGAVSSASTVNGNSATSVSAPGLGGNGADSGSGGGGATAGTGATVVASRVKVGALTVTDAVVEGYDNTIYLIRGGGGGGGGSSSSGGGASGAGGGGGGGGGGMFISSPSITFTTVSIVRSAGGAGGTGASGAGGSGAGGGGGGGGFIILRYLTTYTNQGIVSAPGGAGGTGVVSGTNGSNGTSGTVITVDIP